MYEEKSYKGGHQGKRSLRKTIIGNKSSRTMCIQRTYNDLNVEKFHIMPEEMKMINWDDGFAEIIEKVSKPEELISVRMYRLLADFIIIRKEAENNCSYGLVYSYY